MQSKSRGHEAADNQKVNNGIHVYRLSPSRDNTGGPAAINLGRGRECTALFESYHAFNDKHRPKPQELLIALLSSSAVGKTQYLF